MIDLLLPIFLQEEVCRLLFTLDVQFTGYSGSIDHTQPSSAGPVEQPTCPVCLGKVLTGVIKFDMALI